MLLTRYKINKRTLEQLEQECFLATNALGGYASLSLAGSATRNDHGLLMAAIDDPTNRYLLVRRLKEQIRLQDQSFFLSSQGYVNAFDNEDGFSSFHSFNGDDYPSFSYRQLGVQIDKELVMIEHQNQLVIRYRIRNPLQHQLQLSITPHYTFRAKHLCFSQKEQNFIVKPGFIQQENLQLYIYHNGQERSLTPQKTSALYFAYDERDGRAAASYDHYLNEIIFATQQSEETFTLIFSTTAIDNALKLSGQAFSACKQKLQSLVDNSALQHPLAQQLIKASDAYIICKNKKTETSIIAGYPFFADWGRDSMIVSWGALLIPKRFAEMRNMLEFFARYEKDGLIPNLFDPHTGESRYNTIDASLLFVLSVYAYYQASGDRNFVVQKMLPVIRKIVHHYQQGTHYNIGMRSNYLIAGGSNQTQLTWMDVDYNGVLPTARHGFAVEINAMWYNTLLILKEFEALNDVQNLNLEILTNNIKESFLKMFWSNELGYLHDYVDENGQANEQLRPNQLFALALPFQLLDRQQARCIIEQVHQHLWTPLGLRTLAMHDGQFKPRHTGSHYDRDMAYHQGTVWPFLTGIYGDALMAYLDKDSSILQTFVADMQAQLATLHEGCVGHIAEIYDGENPTQSRGCFAQAWSVSEILRIISKLEHNNYF